MTSPTYPAARSCGLLSKYSYSDIAPSSLAMPDDLTTMRTRPSASSTDIAHGIPLRFRSEEHTSELQSLMRISYAVYCLKKKTPYTSPQDTTAEEPMCRHHHTKLLILTPLYRYS